MTDESIQHELGMLNGTLKSLSDSINIWRDEQRETTNKLFQKIDNLPETCVTGKHLEKRVTELEKRPERVVGFVATVIAIASAIWATFKAGGH